MLFELSEDIWFPDPRLAEEDGLLAIGGDLSTERLLLAYESGIFPWYSEETPILWHSPPERFVLFPRKIKVSSSMRKVIASGIFRISWDQDFTSVIEACASSPRDGQDGTWITAEMKEAYIALHKLGVAHSVEVYKEDVLVGGLYGVAVGTLFCGESMFSRESNASKAALIWLTQNKEFSLIDCQVHTAHLESLGAELISRSEYLQLLDLSRNA